MTSANFNISLHFLHFPSYYSCHFITLLLHYSSLLLQNTIYVLLNCLKHFQFIFNMSFILC